MKVPLRGLNFRGLVEIRENICPRKLPAIRYLRGFVVVVNCGFCSIQELKEPAGGQSRKEESNDDDKCVDSDSDYPPSPKRYIYSYPQSCPLIFITSRF